MRQWNVVAALCCVLTVVYAAGCVYALVTDAIGFTEFGAAVLAILLPLFGYLARMLNGTE